MYIILFFIASIFCLITFFVSRNHFRKKEIFLTHSVEKLRFEKSFFEKESEAKNHQILQLEQSLAQSRKELLEIHGILGSAKQENLALRNLLDELKKENESKKEEITIEYFTPRPAKE